MYFFFSFAQHSIAVMPCRNPYFLFVAQLDCSTGHDGRTQVLVWQALQVLTGVRLTLRLTLALTLTLTLTLALTLTLTLPQTKARTTSTE